MSPLGFTATFGVLYLRRSTVKTEWAKHPAVVFGFIALLSLVDNTSIEEGWPLILIALGVILLYTSLHSHRHIVS